jgi:hypothetical protein
MKLMIHGSCEVKIIALKIIEHLTQINLPSEIFDQTVQLLA